MEHGKMWNVLIWITLLYFLVSRCSSQAFLNWHAESSILLRNLGWNPSYSFGFEQPTVLDDNIGLERYQLVEGDIIPDVYSNTDGSSFNKDNLWPNGRIPYVIDSNLNDHKKDILNAMKYIESVSCLRFVRRKIEKNYIRIFKGNGCNSQVGKWGSGRQNISLGIGCYKQGKIMHELLHAVGFYHEQSRSDRDDYINVHWSNILPGHEQNFYKRKPDHSMMLTPYDYQSIMHYSSYSFSKDKSRGLKTMTAKKEGVILKSPGDKTLSSSDIKRIDILYNCTVFQSYAKINYNLPRV